MSTGLPPYESPPVTPHEPPVPPQVLPSPPREEHGRGCSFYFGWFLAAAFFIISLLLFIAFISLFSYRFTELPGLEQPRRKFAERVVEGRGKDKILLVALRGIITSEPTQRGFVSRPSPVEMIRQQLRQAKDDDRIKALIFRVDSPGGGITASDIIHKEISNFKKEEGRKVVVCMGDVAASGGYYVSACADAIIAHPTTITGSIGVISYQVNIQGLMESLGITANSIKSGPMKDMGSPFRPMTAEEQAVLQRMIDELYDRFLKVVSEGRGIPLGKVKEMADGRVFTGGQALEKGLVDKIGYLSDAVEKAKELAKLEEAKIIRYERTIGLLETLLAETRPSPPFVLNLRDISIPQPPKLMYLWTGRIGVDSRRKD